MTLVVFPPLQFFGRVWKALTLILFKCFAWFTSEAIRSWIFSVGRILITDSIFLLVFCLFRFYISLWFSHCRLYIFRNLSISSSYPNFGIQLFMAPLIIFYISLVTIVTSHISFIILFEFSFFISLAKSCLFCIYFQKSPLNFSNLLKKF